MDGDANMPEYKINIDKKVLRLLGAQLYGDTPSIIAELVQNSYDADAHNVWITISTKVEEVITVEDDVIGMSSYEIFDRFLNIGANRREEFSGVSASGRKVLGRKGIGKLAVFSLAKIVDVYSVKDNINAGCRLDFDKITLTNSDPEAIDESNIKFDKEKLSVNNTGTKIVLFKMQKSIARSFNYVVNRLTRTFDVNDEDFKIYVRKNIEQYKQLSRKALDYFSCLDTVITIGDQFSHVIDLVNSNPVESKYKYAKQYENLIVNRGKITYQPMPYQIQVMDQYGNEKNIMFSFSGWIGTVYERDCFQRFSPADDDDKDKTKFEVTVNDNRISVFSRGKMGEFNILPKTQTNKIIDAYVIGEIYADIFEDDNLADMSISNRRGYDEADQRYVNMIDIVSKLVRLIILRKQEINKLRSDDKKIAEDKIEELKIKTEFKAKSVRTRKILEDKLNRDELNTFEEDLMQFGRALNVSNATKKIFISHKADCTEYGKFLVRVFELIDASLKQMIIFSSLPELGVPHGIDIYDYLKECFRDDLYVIFLFSKSFYNSNVCIAETGAAWATNKNYSNVVIDIGFGDVSEPINRNFRGARLNSFGETDVFVDLVNMFITILNKTGFSYLTGNRPKIEKAIRTALSEFGGKLNGLMYFPSRKFLAVPACPSCSNTMQLKTVGNTLKYVCSSRSCGIELSAEIER